MRILLGIVLAVLVMPDAWSRDVCRVWHETGPYDVCQDRSESPIDWVVSPDVSAPAADSRIRLVTFGGPIGPGDRHALEQIGAEILDFFPQHTYVVRMDSGLDPRVRRLDGVVATGPLPPALKIGKSVTEAVRSGEFSSRGLPLLISFWPGEDPSGNRESILTMAGLELLGEQPGPRSRRMVLRVMPGHHHSLIVELAAMEAVSAVEVHREVVLLNSQGSWLHQSGESGSAPIFDQGIFGCGQTIGVLDSGVDFGHCAFVDPDQATPPISVCDQGSGCSAGTPDPGQRTTSLYYKWSHDSGNLGDAACNTSTGAGHGTHVAASAIGNNLANPADCDELSTPGNQTNLDGTAPGARLIAQEMGEQLEYLNALGGSLYHAGSTAHASGARIHNNSWGTPCFNPSTSQCVPGCSAYGALARDADFLAWDYPNLAVFTAAGNYGQGSCVEQVGAPANAKNIFSIGSNNRGTSGESVSSFSSRGPIIDGRTKPDLMAQGAGIRSAASSGNPATQTCSTCTMSGTSMASPTAAGTAALVREYLERGFYPSGVETPADSITNPSSALVKAIMLNSARFMTGTGGGNGPNQNQGWGRITLDDALHFEGDSRRLFIAEPQFALETGDFIEYRVEVGDSEPFKATLTWTDYPAAQGAGIHLVNQLRLEVETPSGQVWTQKLAEGDPDPFQNIGVEDHDDLNNVHQVVFTTPEAGDYRVRVQAISVPMGSGQSYALAVTGEVEGEIVPSFQLSIDPEELEVCTGDDAIHTARLRSLGAFDDPVSLGISDGLPDGAGVDFSINPVVPGDPAAESQVTIATGNAPTGIHELLLQGDSIPDNHEPTIRTQGMQMRVVAPVVSEPGLVAPADGDTGTSLSPTLVWSVVNQATTWRVQLATDPDFLDPLIDETVPVTVFSPQLALANDTTYYWRVAGLNACGAGDFSEVAQFTTMAQFCSVPGKMLPSGSEVSDLIHVDAAGYLGELAVVLEVAFSWPGDLVARLDHAESGASMELFHRPGVPDGAFGQGCGTADIEVVLADGHPSIQDMANCKDSPPGLVGTLSPAQPLAGLIGPAIEGDWELTLEDTQGFESDGQLLGWCLQFSVDAVSRILFRDRFEVPD